jgi:putative transcriptional regulator
MSEHRPIPFDPRACAEAESARDPDTPIHRPRPVDVKALRAKVGMTQEQFAARFGFSTATLRH